jgi:glycosyltransferase involved in cell wall biosynthesis
MRIVHVVESLDRGGLERMVCDLVADQHAHGWRVSLLCLFHRGLLAQELEERGVEVESVGKSGRSSLRVMQQLRRALRARSPDLVHTHNATAHYHVVVALLGAGAPPVLNTRHGMGAQSSMDRRERFYRWSMPRTAQVVAVCELAARRFVRDGIAPQDLVTVIPNGIRIERFQCDQRQAMRQRLDLDVTAPVVGIVGRLNWAKNHSMLLRAFARVYLAAPQARLVIVGNGELRADIEAQIATLGLATSVVMTGDRSDVPELLSALDVFALSSTTEGYSIALLEASASALPIVATDVGGNREIVQHQHTGLLVAADDEEGFASSLLRLLTDAPLRNTYAANARAWAQRHASVESMSAAYAKLYGTHSCSGALTTGMARSD